MWVVHVMEVDAPQGVEPIEWILLTSLPVESFEDAWLVIGYYEKRWLIEEWHKALKTGCRLEHRQLKTASRLEALTGLLSVVSVRLLQLKSAARTMPDRPAREMVPLRWIAMLQAARKQEGRAPVVDDGRRVLPPVGDVRWIPRPEVRRGTRLDYDLARLAKTLPSSSWCRIGRKKSLKCG